MELSFVIAAVRRRWWLVAILIVLGLLAGLALSGPSVPQYEATSTLLVQSARNGNGVAAVTDPDRYIAGEVAYLEGSVLAEKVVKAVPGTSVDSLAQSVRVVSKEKSNVVKVIATTIDPALSQSIVNAYATIYVDDVNTRESKGNENDIADIDKSLTELAAQMEAIGKKRAVFPPNSPLLTDREADAQLYSQWQQLNSLYTTLLGTQTQLKFSLKVKSQTTILQTASLPTVPLASSRSLIAVGGVFLGAMLGVVAAIVFANTSKKLLDVVQLGEILGAPSVGTMPLTAKLAEEPKAAFESLPDNAAAIVDRLCVRSEASAQGETSALTIAVVGSQRGAGSTTIALAMAGRFARNGARTVVIDADLADPQISRSFNALDDAGIPGLLARLAAARNEPLPPGAPAPVPPEALPSRVFTPTSLPDVRVLGVGAPTKARSLHRTNVDVVIEASSRGGVDVVIIDGGPLLDSASTVRLCQVVDVVVLVVPVTRQQIEPLGVIQRLLSYRSGDLLTVATKLKPRADARPKVAEATDNGDVDDIIEAATRYGNRTGARPRQTPPFPAEWDTAPAPPTPSRRAAEDRWPGTLRPDPPMPASPRLGAPPPRRVENQPPAADPPGMSLVEFRPREPRSDEPIDIDWVARGDSEWDA